jgi:hypothetical protein
MRRKGSTSSKIWARPTGIRAREPERLGPIELVSIAEKLDLIFQVPVGRTVVQSEPAATTAAAILDRTVQEPPASLPAALASGGSPERTLAEGTLALPAGWKGEQKGAGADTAIVDGLPLPPDNLLRRGSVPADATVIESEPPKPPEPPRRKRD